MKLWLIKSAGWGFQIDIVRAETEADARRVGFAGPIDTVIELSPEGGEEILYTYEYSPDSR